MSKITLTTAASEHVVLIHLQQTKLILWMLRIAAISITTANTATTKN